MTTHQLTDKIHLLNTIPNMSCTAVLIADQRLTRRNTIAIARKKNPKGDFHMPALASDLRLPTSNVEKPPASFASHVSQREMPKGIGISTYRAIGSCSITA